MQTSPVVLLTGVGQTIEKPYENNTCPEIVSDSFYIHITLKLHYMPTANIAPLNQVYFRHIER